MSGIDWSRLMSKVEIVGSLHPLKDYDWDALAKRLKLSALPPSYVEYARLFGPGSWKPDLIISIPDQGQGPVDLDWEAVSYQRILDVRFGEELQTEYPELSGESLQVAIDAYEEEFPRARRERLRRLVPIGEINSYAWLCLDPDTLNGRGEMGMYLVPIGLHRAISCGRTLYEFLDAQWIGGKIDETCGLEEGASFESKPVFRAADAEGSTP